MNDSVLIFPAVAEDLNIGNGRVLVPAPSGEYILGNQINLSSFAIRQTFTWVVGTLAADGQPGSVAANTFAVNGAALGFPCLVAYDQVIPIAIDLDPPRVQASNTARLSLFNRGGQPVNVGTLTGTILVFPIPPSGL